MIGVLVALCSAVLLWWLYLKVFNYWDARGVPYLTPVLPLLGNMYDILLLKCLPDIVDRIYRQTKDLPYVGIYIFHTPVLFVQDLDLSARILINDFNYFVDRGFSYNESDVLGRNLIHQKESEWRVFRPKLSPCFNITKVKSMFPSIMYKSAILLDRIENEQANNGFVDIWDLSLRFSTDALTHCTMGVEANSLQNHTAEFLETGKRILGFHFIFHVLSGCFLPGLHKCFRISVAISQVKDFFQAVVTQIINYRKDHNIERKDLIQTLMQLREESRSFELGKQIPEVDENFIVAQSFVFFMAGFETPAGAISYTLYELAKSPLIQKALIQDITHVLGKYNGHVTFDAIQDMKYLHRVVTETLRKYPPLSIIFRQCTKPYTIPGTSTVIEKGTHVLLPVNNIHHDALYYPDPEVFNPERFSDMESAARHIAAYMPFGIGPRLCPAVLYSLVKIKIALVQILLQYNVHLAAGSPTYLTPNPLKFLLTPKNRIFLTFKNKKTRLEHYS